MEKNTFFDMKKLPAKEGLILFPISMSRISNSQNGERYFEYVQELTKRLSKGVVGITFIYTDNLYEKYNQLEDASKNKSLGLILSHKNQFLKNIINKSSFAVNAFEFSVWMQLIIDSENFDLKLSKIKEFYKKDALLQKYVKEDIKHSGRKVTEDFINFILEETLLAYLMLYEDVDIRNKYVNGRDKWRFLCYPGKPNKSMMYFLNKNIFNLKTGNPFKESMYDLENKKLYEAENMDLETWNYE